MWQKQNISIRPVWIGRDKTNNGGAAVDALLCCSWILLGSREFSKNVFVTLFIRLTAGYWFVIDSENVLYSFSIIWVWPGPTYVLKKWIFSIQVGIYI